MFSEIVTNKVVLILQGHTLREVVSFEVDSLAVFY